jgi:hypothetical protein
MTKGSDAYGVIVKKNQDFRLLMFPAGGKELSQW